MLSISVAVVLFAAPARTSPRAKRPVRPESKHQAYACNAVGALQTKKKNPARDVAAGIKNFKRACQDGCDDLSTFCKAGVPSACEAATR